MVMIYLFCFFILTKYAQSKGANIYDTYNADECQRVRKSWTSLDNEEKQFYIDALMELRARGENDIDKDEFVAIGSVHEDDYGEVDHSASSYLFWHGYILWELESRIRNLGGRYKCFAMPYWDFSDGSESDAIFSDILGGHGDPDNYYNVNGYSWKYTTQQFWVPAHCDAEGDEYPVCSLKRSTSETSMPSPEKIGSGIIDHPVFADFDEWYSANVNLPHNLLTDSEYLHFPVVTSYDPIWYLFHSMVSYHQAIWTDCNEYDMINPNELDNHPEAYQPFCDEPMCGDMQLDDVMTFGGTLQDKEWSFIHNNDLTVRKSYYFPQWNIIYDLGNGDGFFTDSGLKEYCEGKLNPDWFMLTDDDEVEEDVVLEAASIDLGEGVVRKSYQQLIFAVMGVVMIAVALLYNVYVCFYGKRKVSPGVESSFNYGTI